MLNLQYASTEMLIICCVLRVKHSNLQFPSNCLPPVEVSLQYALMWSDTDRATSEWEICLWQLHGNLLLSQRILLHQNSLYRKIPD